MLQFVIPGKPVPLQRPRFGGNHVYNPQADLIEYNYWLLKRSMPKNLLGQVHKPFEGPLKVDIAFHMEIPTSTPNKKKAGMVWSYHSKRPDIDNFIKLLFDSAIGSVFKDDCQVVQLTACKVYSLEPLTRMTVIPLLESEQIKIIDKSLFDMGM